MSCTTFEERMDLLRARLARFEREHHRQNRRQARRERQWHAFHLEGSRKYRQWGRYCRTIVDKGADPQIAELIVYKIGSVELVPLLFRNRTLLEELAAMKTRRERAWLLQRVAETAQ
jgi:hypothetical protein